MNGRPNNRVPNSTSTSEILLDTNALAALLRGNAEMVCRVRHYGPHDFGLPAVVAHEHYFGIFRSCRTADNLARFDALQFELVSFDREDGRQAAAIRAELAASSSPIGPYDALTAGQAKSRHLTLITRNVGEFSRVSGLQIENWES
jgi:tRNA(fMet)-specific endonuclease VapC